MRELAVAAALLLVAAGCDRLPVVGAGGGAGSLENRVWVDTDDDAPRGSLRAFLSDGTLIMTSCTETYRLAAWRWIEAGTVVWDEDGAFIRARVDFPARDEMALAMELGGETVVRHYRQERAPVVCPDLR